jgi:integrase
MAAFIEAKRQLEKTEEELALPESALLSAVNAYLVDAAEIHRSEWRIDGIRWNFHKIIPFFGAATPISEITTGQIQKLVLQRKYKDQVKPKTIWHDITNLRALFNWARKPREGADGRKIPPLLIKNPVDDLNMSIIGNTRSKKAPLNLAAVERAAEVLNSTPADRAYFDFLRFTGLRKDEANNLRWDDINFDEGYFHCRGTKTHDSDAYLPLAKVLIETLKRHKEESTSEYVFAGTSRQTKGKKIYSRRRMFERIQKTTAIENFRRQHPGLSQREALDAVQKENFSGGIKLVPKDLRDYFASTVQTDDPRVLMSLMRHTSLNTTTKYLRTLQQSMKNAVNNLGTDLGANQNRLQGQKSAERSTSQELAQSVIERLKARKNGENFGGGGRSRTADAADMSRVL